MLYVLSFCRDKLSSMCSISFNPAIHPFFFDEKFIISLFIILHCLISEWSLEPLFNTSSHDLINNNACVPASYYMIKNCNKLFETPVWIIYLQTVVLHKTHFIAAMYTPGIKKPGILGFTGRIQDYNKESHSLKCTKVTTNKRLVIWADVIGHPRWICAYITCICKFSCSWVSCYNW